MDEMGTPGPNHPAHRGLKTPDNVIELPGMKMRKARLLKNDILDAILGPEKVTYKSEEPKVESPVEQSVGRNNNDFHEARITSMGKFKEEKANRELMNRDNE